MEWWKFLIVIVVSYFLGNVNFARVISARMNKDITKEGSGNPGTMNMLRSFGFKSGILTLVFDALKGVLSALLGFGLFGGFGACYVNLWGLHASSTAMMGLYIGGLACIIGHNFPVIYKFKGGKGVACMLGVFAVSSPVWVAICFVFGFIYLYIFDYAAMASFLFISIVTFIEALKYTGENQNLVVTILLFIMFCLTWFMHRKNITRLLVGKEKKANLKASLKKKYNKKDVKTEIKEIKQVKKEDKKKEIG